ncbi:MAG: hypothetical protein NT024_02845, partial [Proteobacteria bacterium]|nr:hypothetical protein [Pseudomonadota bacterium]
MNRPSGEVKIEGPSWELRSEYPGPDAAELAADLRALSELLDQIEALNPTLVAALPLAAGLDATTAAPSLAAAQQV